MTYLEEYLNEHKTNMRGFFTAQEDYDGFCPRDMGMDDCTGMEDCLKCWNREIEENE